MRLEVDEIISKQHPRLRKRFFKRMNPVKSWRRTCDVCQCPSVTSEPFNKRVWQRGKAGAMRIIRTEGRRRGGELLLNFCPPKALFHCKHMWVLALNSLVSSLNRLPLFASITHREIHTFSFFFFVLLKEPLNSSCACKTRTR